MKSFIYILAFWGSLFTTYDAFAVIEINTITHISAPCSGDIDITATGTAGPFTFEWNGPNGFTATTEDLHNLCQAGVYLKI